MFQSSSRESPTSSTLLSSWRELIADGETRLLLFTAMCVGTAEFALEGPVMMALGGVLGFNVADNAAFLSAYNVPRGVVSVLAEPILRRVPAQVLAAGGLLSAACGVAWLAAGRARAQHVPAGRVLCFCFRDGLASACAVVRLRSGAGSRRGLRARLAARSAGAGGSEAEARRAYGAAFGPSAVMAKAGGGRSAWASRRLRWSAPDSQPPSAASPRCCSREPARWRLRAGTCGWRSRSRALCSLEHTS